MNVLIVEDETDFRESLIEILAIKGHDAIGIGSVSEFFLLSSTHQFDLMVIDCSLPDGDGLQILREVRASCKVPIAVVSGATELESSLDALSKPDLFIKKPFAIQPLLAFIEKHARTLTKKNN